LKTLFTFFKTGYLNEEVNCTKPSVQLVFPGFDQNQPLLSITWVRPETEVNGPNLFLGGEVGGLEELGDVEDEGGNQDRKNVLDQTMLESGSVVNGLLVVQRVVDCDVPASYRNGSGSELNK
jgi:hypothetical protein